jgi:hypothetical protein
VVKNIIILLMIGCLLLPVGCKTTKRTFDPVTGTLISEEDVYDVQTTILFIEAATTGVQNLADLYTQYADAKDEKEKAKIQAKIDMQQRRLEMAARIADKLLPTVKDNPELTGRIEQILASYTKPAVAAEAAKKAVKEKSE